MSLYITIVITTGDKMLDLLNRGGEKKNGKRFRRGALHGARQV